MHCIALFILAFAIYPSAYSIGSSDLTLSWRDIVELTRQSNPELRSQQLKLDVASSQLRVSQSAYYPKISANFDVSRSKRDFLQDNSNQEDYQYNAGIVLRQNIFSGLADKFQIEASKLDVEITNLAMRQLKLRLGSELIEAYAQLIYAQASEQLQSKIIHRRQENLSIVTLRYENGRENKGSVLQSQAYLESARFEYEQSSQNQMVYRQKLANMMGREHLFQFQVDSSVDEGLLDERMTTKNREESSSRFLEIAKKHPDVLAAELASQRANTQIRVSKSQFYPSLETRAQYLRADDRFFPDRSSWSISLGVSYPLYNGGSDYAQVSKAQAAYEDAVVSREVVLRSKVDQLQLSYANYSQALRQLSIEKLFENAAITRAEIARSKYNNGLMSFEEWDRIESELISRQKSVLRLERDLKRAYASWIAAQGKEIL